MSMRLKSVDTGALKSEQITPPREARTIAIQAGVVIRVRFSTKIANHHDEFSSIYCPESWWKYAPHQPLPSLNEVIMSQTSLYDEYDEIDDQPSSRNAKTRARSADYDKKRRRAEHILEQARLRELLGYDIDYQD